MIDDETEVQRDLEAQMDLAMEGVRKAVLRLLQDGEVHPKLVLLAVARIAGELGADIAQAGDVNLETILADVTEVVRKAGRAHHELLRAEELRVAGTA
jgi:glycine/D-amino acid oxidase-like deaminating enzyme